MRQFLGRLALYFSIVVITSPALFFVFWMISLSFKYKMDGIASPPIWFPPEWTLENFQIVLGRSEFVRYGINSVITSVSAVMIGLVIGVPAAYGVAKAGLSRFMLVILFTRITPAMMYIIPLFYLFRFVGLNGTYAAVIIALSIFTIPFTITIMLGYFEDTPAELEEAGLVDGANIFQSFFHIALPLARGGMAVTAILTFIGSWNNFVFSLIFGSLETYTLPMAIFQSISSEGLSFGTMAASALLVTLPTFLLAIVMQRQIVTGLTAGGIKG
jgi:multiple sugar transport system permease protein